MERRQGRGSFFQQASALLDHNDRTVLTNQLEIAVRHLAALLGDKTGHQDHANDEEQDKPTWHDRHEVGGVGVLGIHNRQRHEAKKVSIRRVISIWSLSPKTRVEACQITVDRINSSRFINGGGAGGQNTVKQSLRGSPNKAQADLNWDYILLYLNTKKQGEGPSSPYSFTLQPLDEKRRHSRHQRAPDLHQVPIAHCVLYGQATHPNLEAKAVDHRDKPVARVDDAVRSRHQATADDDERSDVRPCARVVG